MLKETYYNKYKGWGISIPSEAIEINVMRSLLAPSQKLLDNWKNKNISWEEYTKIFREEIYNNPKSIQYLKEIKELSKTKDIYLVCACYNSKKQCHRYLLIDMINNL